MGDGLAALAGPGICASTPWIAHCCTSPPSSRALSSAPITVVAAHGVGAMSGHTDPSLLVTRTVTRLPPALWEWQTPHPLGSISTSRAAGPTVSDSGLASRTLTPPRRAHPAAASAPPPAPPSPPSALLPEEQSSPRGAAGAQLLWPRQVLGVWRGVKAAADPQGFAAARAVEAARSVPAECPGAGQSTERVRGTVLGA